MTELTAAPAIDVVSGTDLIPIRKTGTAGLKSVTPDQLATYLGVQPFSGCLLYKSANQALSASTDTAITWDQEEYDIGGWHTGSNADVIVPAGITRVLVSGRATRTSATDQLIMKILKSTGGGAYTMVPGLPSQETDTSGVDSVSASSAVIFVTPGDKLQMQCYVGVASSIQGTNAESWFHIRAA